VKTEEEQFSPFVNGYLNIIVKNLRRLRGTMSQENFSKKAGVSLTTIQRMESGKNFEIVSLLKIAERLGISPFDLYLTEEEKTKIKMAEEERENALYEKFKTKLRLEKLIK